MNSCRAALAFLMVAVGCTPLPSPEASLERTNREFDGRDAGLFFASYGSPAGVHTAGDGDRLYRWISMEPHGGGRRGGYIHYPGDHYGALPDASNGETVTGYCEVSIRADADDVIRKITLVNDSIGKFSGSRCSEIFSQSPG